MLKKFIDFHKDLMNANTATSHRRYLAIFFAYNGTIISYIGIIFQLSVLEIVLALLSASLAYGGLTTWSSNLALKAKSNVVKSDSSEQINEPAKNIIE